MNYFVSVALREAVRILEFVFRAFAHTWPLWVVSIPLAAAVRMSSLAGKLKRVLSMRPVAAVIVATVFGAVSPLCSCSVVPVIFSLLTAGVPLAPVMSFWLASPSMDPEVFFLSVSAIGWPLATARLAATTLMSLGGGLVALVLERQGWFAGGILRDEKKPAKAARKNDSGLFRPVAAGAFSLAPALAPCCPSEAAPCACSSPPSAHASARFVAKPPSAAQGTPGCGRARTPSRSVARRFARELVSSVFFVARFMAIAFALEAAISFYVPESLIRSVLGTRNPFAVPLAVLVGIPFYTTNAQALGMVGGLIGKGMSEGAALAFLIGGATTTLPAMSAVFGIAKPRVFVVYLGSAVAASLATGLVWSLF